MMMMISLESLSFSSIFDLSKIRCGWCSIWSAESISICFDEFPMHICPWQLDSLILINKKQKGKREEEEEEHRSNSIKCRLMNSSFVVDRDLIDLQIRRYKISTNDVYDKYIDVWETQRFTFRLLHNDRFLCSNFILWIFTWFFRG